jgi:hypothetical protein
MTRITTLAVCLLAAGCPNSDPKRDGAQAEKPAAATVLAPAATTVVPAKAPTADARKLAVDKATSHVDFMMEAPEEKIVGHVPGTVTGEFQIDPMDVSKSTGLVMVDLSSLEVVQTKVDAGKSGPEKKVEAQNTHARAWLEIGPDAPEDKRKENSIVKFAITAIQATGETNLTKLSGAERSGPASAWERKVPLKVTGDFLLHGRKAQKVVELEGTFKFQGDTLTGATFKSVKPFGVDLAEHDVKPRDAFGKLALKTLEALAPKVAKEAMVSLEISTAAPQ